MSDPRKVTLTDQHGDQVAGLWRAPVVSDMPATIQVGSTRWHEEVWSRDGWYWSFDD